MEYGDKKYGQPSYPDPNIQVASSQNTVDRIFQALPPKESTLDSRRKTSIFTV